MLPKLKASKVKVKSHREGNSEWEEDETPLKSWSVAERNSSFRDTKRNKVKLGGKKWNELIANLACICKRILINIKR